MSDVVYDPSVYFCDTVDDARSIILTPEAGLTSDERWERETEWLLPRLDLTGCRLAIDYGCGIGRIAKHLPIPVIGVDISPTMEIMALRYVARLEFAPMTPEMLVALVNSGLRADAALTIWSLQHVPDPANSLRLLRRALLPDAPLYMVNRGHRCVPARQGDRFGWVDDGKDIEELLGSAGFQLLHSEAMPSELCEADAWFSHWVRV